MDWGPIILAAIVALPATIAALAAAVASVISVMRTRQLDHKVDVLKHNTDGMIKDVQSIAKAAGKSEGITEERARGNGGQSNPTGV